MKRDDFHLTNSDSNGEAYLKSSNLRIWGSHADDHSKLQPTLRDAFQFGT